MWVNLFVSLDIRKLITIKEEIQLSCPCEVGLLEGDWTKRALPTLLSGLASVNSKLTAVRPGGVSCWGVTWSTPPLPRPSLYALLPCSQLTLAGPS